MNKKGMAALLIIPIALLIIINSTFILASNASVFNSESKSDKSNLNIVKSNYYEVELDDENERDIPIAGTQLERASAAALEYIGEGRVTDSEIGDEEGYYEIEITTNGGQVDVHLDEDFNVLSTEWEDDEDDD